MGASFAAAVSGVVWGAGVASGAGMAPGGGSPSMDRTAGCLRVSSCAVENAFEVTQYINTAWGIMHVMGTRATERPRNAIFMPGAMGVPDSPPSSIVASIITEHMMGRA